MVEIVRESPLVQLMMRAEEIANHGNEIELKKNDILYRDEDKKLWQASLHVIGLDGRPMPTKAKKTKEVSDSKSWDCVKPFQFGLWGFRQRPYSHCQPIDVAQAIGYNRLNKTY